MSNCVTKVRVQSLRPRSTLICVLAAGLSLLVAGRAPAQVVMFSTDTEGQLTPCVPCGAEGGPGAGGGDIARRATVVAEARKAGDVLLLDGGNALFGDDSAASGGRVVAAAYAKLAYDAVGVSFRDFRLGKAHTVEVLRDLPATSANLLDAASGKPLFQPFVVKTVAGRKVAVVSVTELPAALDDLPHLSRQLKGITVAPAADALGQVLPQARSQADAVVLMYYGPSTRLRAVVERFGKDVACVLAGGVRPEALPVDSKPPVAGTVSRGRTLAKLVLASETAAEPVVVDRSIEPDPALVETFAQHSATPDPFSAGSANAPQPTLPANLKPDRIYPLRSSTANRGLRVTVVNASLTRTFAARQAPEGRQWLVLSTEWENVIPWTVIDEKQVPTAYRIPQLFDHLYVVADGNVVARLMPRANDVPGHVPVKDFHLAQIGDRVRGNAVFELPEGTPKSLELRFYDFAHGHASLPLLTARGTLPARPLSAPVANEVVEAALFGFKRVGELNGQPAPEGMTYVVADLRARSLFTFDGDATAFDPKAQPGQKMKVGTVADWTEAHQHLQLVVDGEYGYAALPVGTTLPAEPRFLPDVMTGGQVAFVAPAEAKSLELRCDFPNAKTPSGQVIRPKGLTLAVEGERPQTPKRNAILSIDDDVFQVTVTGQSAAQTFSRAAAGDGEKFVVLDVTVLNAGKTGEIFQTAEQLKYVSASGEFLAADDATWSGIYRPSQRLWIPAGERRTFQVAFRVPAGELKPRLGYQGVSKAEVYPLTPF